MEQLLDPIFELVRLVLADVFDPRPIMAERRLLHGCFELGVVDPVELEHEEQEMRGGSRDALLHVGVELRAGGIDGVTRMHETGIRNEPAEKIVKRLVTLDRLDERRTRSSSVGERRKLAL